MPGDMQIFNRDVDFNKRTTQSFQILIKPTDLLVKELILPKVTVQLLVKVNENSCKISVDELGFVKLPIVLL